MFAGREDIKLDAILFVPEVVAKDLTPVGDNLSRSLARVDNLFSIFHRVREQVGIDLRKQPHIHHERRYVIVLHVTRMPNLNPSRLKADRKMFQLRTYYLLTDKTLPLPEDKMPLHKVIAPEKALQKKAQLGMMFLNLFLVLGQTLVQTVNPLDKSLA